MNLKVYIKKYREEHELSQRQLADMCGLSNGYISMLEKGENPKTQQPLIPTIQALNKLASGMGISLTTLLSEIDDMPVDIDFYANEKMPTSINESEHADPVDLEIITILYGLSKEKKAEALRYLRYLANIVDM